MTLFHETVFWNRGLNFLRDPSVINKKFISTVLVAFVDATSVHTILVGTLFAVILLFITWESYANYAFINEIVGDDAELLNRA